MEQFVNPNFLKADPKTMDWSVYAEKFSFYVGPIPDPDGYPNPEDGNVDFYTFDIACCNVKHTLWAVLHRNWILDKTLNRFVYQPFSSNQDDEFRKSTRFKTREAAFKALQRYLSAHEPKGPGWAKKTKASSKR